jgi:2,3-bisphosphoglycerate-independent phosphoglycerate mutase
MTVLPTGGDFDAELDTVEEHMREHDFVFLHYKPADAAGEDGDFDEKVKTLEELDSRIPRLLGLGADVLAVAGDHSTPSILGAHSWHPVPLLINSDLTSGAGSAAFNERSCAAGQLGTQQAISLMLQLLAHAGKLKKFGA